MPNLKPWIEAQLKRGYSKSQIKKVLVKKGYPLNAVAEVDEVRDSELSGGKIFKKNYNFIIILVVVAVIIGAVYFIGGDKGVENPTTTEETPHTIGEIPPTEEDQTSDIRFIRFIEDICNEFPSLEKEISCEDAVNTALEQYPGEVYSVDKTLMIPAPVDQNPTEKFWAIGINLDTPLERELPPGTNDIERKLFSEIDIDTSKIQLFISLSKGTIETSKFG